MPKSFTTFACKRKQLINKLPNFNMTRLFATLTFFLFCCAHLFAQQLTVKSFEVDQFDNTAYTQPRKDYNNQYCAVVKVRFPQKGGEFEGKVFDKPLFKTNEYWVYITEGAKHLVCKFPDYETLDVIFADYGITGLKQKTVYILKLKGTEKNGLESIEKGDPKEMLKQAQNYEKGIGTYSKDLKHAKHWYEQAAEAGSIEAQDYLADVCFEGKNGFQQDYYDAFRWHKIAAQRERIDSYYPLAQMYALGNGTKKNKQEAINWLKKYNKERNHAEAQLLLANLLDPKDELRVEYYKKAANNGIAEAMYKYAEAIKYKDRETSERYMHKAKEMGYPPKAKEPDAQPTTVATVQEKVQQQQPVTTTSNSDDFSWLSQRRVTAADLQGKSKAELRILRNAIYARHGYKFKSADLMSYFKKYSWYHPQSSDVSAQLSSLEQSNVQFIKSYE